jgi:hypothetical protein
VSLIGLVGTQKYCIKETTELGVVSSSLANVAPYSRIIECTNEKSAVA